MQGGAAGITNTITLGGAEGAAAAYADGGGVTDVAVGWYRGQAETVLPLQEGRTLLDSKKNGWEKAEAIATGTVKVASLGLMFAEGAAVLKSGGAPTAEVVTETATGKTAAVAPMESVRPPAASGGMDVHPGRLAAESTEVSKESVMRALRQSNTAEGAATAKLIKRGKVDMNIVEQLDPGVGGQHPMGTNQISISKEVSAGNPGRAAGYAAHETRHVLQEPMSTKTYGKYLEFDPYRWQRKVDPGFFLNSDEAVFGVLKANPVYQQFTWRGQDVRMPQPAPLLPK